MTRIGDIHSTATTRLKSSSSFFLLPGWSWMSNCYYYSHRSLRNRPMNQRRVVEPPLPYPRPPPHRRSWSTCIGTRMKWEGGGGCVVLVFDDFAVVVGSSLPFFLKVVRTGRKPLPRTNNRKKCVDLAWGVFRFVEGSAASWSANFLANRIAPTSPFRKV